MKVPVNCPNCNKRLFDVEAGSQGVIVIKCPRCKSFDTFNLQGL